MEFDDYEYESIDDIARGEGFYIDDDGHWIPLEEDLDDDYEPEYLDPDELFDDYDYDDVMDDPDE